MANITAALVKELRERTGAGMMDCKKALVAADGDIEKAIDDMRKNGQAKAAKKAGRVTAEGVIVSAVNGNKTMIMEVNCETDFVAKDASFNEFCNNAVKIALDNNVTDIEALKALKYTDSEDTVEATLNNLIAKIGENMSLRRIAVIEGENVGLYIHGNKRIGVLVDMIGGDNEVAKDVAMHICGCTPLYVKPEDVPAEEVERERQVQLEIALKENAESGARRAAAYSLEERRRAAVPPYHDSIDSLRDSPHSERSVSVTCAHFSQRAGTTDLGPILWSLQKHSKEPHPCFSDGQARSLKSSMFCSGSLTR